MKDDKLTSFEVLGRKYQLPFSNIGSKTKEHILIEATLLFALRGYSDVSMRDIAERVGITAAGLYNHFANKEDLWEAVLEHIINLYHLYHEQLEEALKDAQTLEQLVDVISEEPRQMRNMFTCYGFGLIMKEQFSDIKAGALCRDILMGYGTSFTKKWLDYAVERGMAKPFDTDTFAKIFVYSVLSSINLKVQESTVQGLQYDIASTFDGIKALIMKAAQ